MSESTKSSPFYQNLNQGFQFLSDHRKATSHHPHQQKKSLTHNKNDIPPQFNEALYFNWDVPPKIIVNVIDPIRKVSTKSSTTAPLYFSRFHQYIQRKCNFRIPVSSSNLTKDKLLSSSSSSSSAIHSSSSTIPIQLVINASPLTNQQRPSMISSNHTCSSIDIPEWYSDPSCHVYLAACSSLEHYKKSVKPSISAFLNQIDGTVNSTNSLLTTSTSTSNLNNARQAAETAKSVVQASGHYYWSRQCILVLLPIKEGTHNSSSSSISSSLVYSSPTKDTTSNTSTSNMSRSMSLNDVTKKIFQDKLSSEMDDTSSSLSQNSSSMLSHHYATNLLSTLSKDMKALLKIVATDFPSARTCVLSSLGSIALDNILESEDCIRSTTMNDDSLGDTNEWNTFIQSLSDAVASGFQDRIDRYEDELKGMDLQLLSAAQSLKKSISKKQKQTHRMNNPTTTTTTAYNNNNTKKKNEIALEDEQEEDEEYCSLMKRYFLVKEGLALSYLQIHNHLDALRLYQQMDEMALITGKWKAQWDDSELLTYPSMRLVDVAHLGDSRLFRQVLSYQQRFDLIQLYYIAKIYFMTRQVQLLFLLDHPLEILQRCIEFIQKNYSWKSLSSKAYNMGEAYLDDASQLFVEAWSVEVCWGLYTAYNQFYMWTSSKSRPLASKTNNDEERSATKGISDLLHFTRKRLITISRILFSTRCAPYRAYNLFFLNDTHRKQVQSISTDELSIDQDNEYLLGSRQKCASRFSWIGKAFSSQTEFNSMYHRFCDSIVSTYYILGYNRSAARLLMEKAEMLAFSGNNQEAASIVLKAFDKNGCSFRGWTEVSSWSYSRLLNIHRESGPTSLYVTLLISILSRPTYTRLPMTIAHDLQKELEHSIGNNELCTEFFRVSPFTIDLYLDRKQNHEYFLFDSVQLTVNVRSSLPHTISVDRLSCVTIYTVEELYDPLDDASSNFSWKEFTIDRAGPFFIDPGLNRVQLEWCPIFPGHYKLLKSNLFLREAKFVHENSTNGCGTFAHVKSYEPSQKLLVYPPFLYPRGIQHVFINFDSGSDEVEEATLLVECCDKVQIIIKGDESDNDHFTKSSKLTLGSLKPETALNRSFLVQCDWQNEIESKSSLDIQLISKYRHAKFSLLPQKLKDFIPVPSSQILTSSVNIVGVSPFYIDTSKSFEISNGCIVINIKLSCHSTRPTSLTSWSIDYPSQYQPIEETDMNIGLFERSLTVGDEIFLGFKCQRNHSTNKKDSDSRPILHLIYSNEYAESFNQDFLLDVNLEHSINFS